LTSTTSELSPPNLWLSASSTYTPTPPQSHRRGAGLKYEVPAADVAFGKLCAMVEGAQLARARMA
jgi:hypothetical protein